MQRSLSPTPEFDPRERALAKTLGIPDLMARVLLARGLDDPDLAKEHLRPNLAKLHDPFLFQHMQQAVERIKHAVRHGENIMIHGDYDVDGVTGTVLLTKFFSLMEAEVKPFIPDRKDGYSITKASLRAVKDGKVKLLISVDNGTNAVEAIELIQAAGCDVIVTDHHGTSEGVAPAHTILNPRLPDAGYPDPDLAGVGVAFRLASAVAKSFSPSRTLSPEFRTFLLEAMAYVALGTVADVAPLCGENRILVHHGLRALAVSKNPGIRALLDSAGLGDKSPDARDIAFRIAPLINAAGRMGHAKEAVTLLMSPGYQEAQEAAKVLEVHNTNRRRVEREVLDEVLPLARAMQDEVLVLGGEGWHRGVLGIVAARLAETLSKPTILLSFSKGVGRGSGRSAGGFDLHGALCQCAEYLTTYGGHRAAVGMELPQTNLNSLRQRINKAAAETQENNLPFQVDGNASLRELDPQNIRRLDMLGPFGPKNRQPVFVTKDLKIVGNPTTDSHGRDLRFRVAKEGVVMPVKLHRGAQLFETVRNIEGMVTLYYSPRLAQWAEDGPVYLQAWRIQSNSSSSSNDNNSGTKSTGDAAN